MNDDMAAAHAQIAQDLRQGGVLDQRLPGYEERPAQIEMAEAVAAALISGQHLLVEAGTGTGKALDSDTPIPTLTGWKRMGDLQIGDTLFDEAGHLTHVTAAFDILEHRRCFEVHFSDGTSLVADAEHEWMTSTHADRKWSGKRSQPVVKNFVTTDLLREIDHCIAIAQEHEVLAVKDVIALVRGHHWTVMQAIKRCSPIQRNTRQLQYPRRLLLQIIRERLAEDLMKQRRDGRACTLVTTEMMAQTLRVGKYGRANYAIAVTRPLVLPEMHLPIDPYFLGVWLGDGSSRSHQITTADPGMIEEIEKAGYTVRPLKSHPLLFAVDDEHGKVMSRWQPGITSKLRTLGLILNKHIPAMYLRASEPQRRQLLAGLLDSDGTVNRQGAIEFTTTNPQLAQHTCELICSLGFLPSMRQGRATLYGKDCGPQWTICFTTDVPVFRLPRKHHAHDERLRHYTPQRNQFRYVVAIEEVPSRPVRCIQVDSPSHLYLAGTSMIPTHNSLAYLLPIVRSGKKALVATANKALQEQLYHKDLPFIQEHIEPRLKAALVKGVSNYVCLKHVEEERGFQNYAQNPGFQQLLRLTHSDDFDGDLDVLPFALPGDVRGRVATDSDDCAWRECQFFNACYVRKMRAQAEAAQIVVVNHTLLLIDVLNDNWILPERDLIVLDEAHHLEDEATRAFTATVAPRRVDTLLQQKRLRANCDPDKLNAALDANVLLWAHLDDALRFGHHAARIPLIDPVEEGLRLGTAIAELGASLRQRKPEEMEASEEQLYDKLTRRVSNLAADLRLVFGVKDTERVYYAEREPGRRGKEGAIAVSATPLAVADFLKDKLFDRISVVATSATLAINGSFDFFRQRVGVGEAREIVLPYAFDYEHHALLYVPYLNHEPAFGKDQGPYLDELAEQMGALVRASRGRAFLLFTSNRAMNGVFDRVSSELGAEGFNLFLQGGDVGRSELVRRFKTADQAVLFGLRSFWEGVDVVGEALSLVVIDKLPFDPPDDPVHEARVNRMRAAGQNWFGEYTLPLAILRLKQGVGRLLRSREDRGVLAILDSRLLKKGYGRRVIFALPPAQRTTDLNKVRAFFV